ncbi:MAG: hypothetical protein HN392_06380 [Anaerolineae bacterium]|jgi:hypothetical protein|nr:hypothetical protein [Anaerolineae bacterium]MBT7075697.1 hypothetical protein [Anaerolineae bacterium]MBT7783028.1 hypothetical protein [Anaerolineae bacterium]
MNLNKFTPKLIERLLKNWQKGNFDLDDLTLLGFAPTKENPIEEQRLIFREKFYEHINENLPHPFSEAVASQNHARILLQYEKLFQESPSNAQYFAIIYYRYLGIKKYGVRELGEISGVSERTLRRYILRAFDMLSLQLQSKKLTKKKIFTEDNIKDYFPNFAENQVVGTEETLTKIIFWLETKKAYHAISIEGLGGIGKTLIAKHLLKDQYKKANFENYAWVSARQTELAPSGEIATVDNFANTLDDVVARLAHQLGQNHLAGLSTQDKIQGLKTLTAEEEFLIIIDNLETVDDVDKLVPELLKLANPTKIIFTSRKSLDHYPDLQTLRTPELSRKNSQLLVGGEMARAGNALTLSDESMDALYQITGGFPLALKLATAQFGFFSAKDILHQLRSGKENSKNLYTYIYRQAWILLDDMAKKLLLTMLNISPDGEDQEWICDIGNLQKDDFRKGLEKLKELSLIEFSGTIERPLYRIHRLTTTFLQTDILEGWEDNKS